MIRQRYLLPTQDGRSSDSPSSAKARIEGLTTRQRDLIDINRVLMVIYNLLCKKKHRFEGWFPSFEDFQKQRDKKLISCPSCGTTKVEKVPHACAVHVKKEETLPAKKPRQQPPAAVSPAEFNEMLIKVHHYVKENFEDVGSRFAEEARQIHKGEAAERPIHGTATIEETKELADEGVPFLPLPKPELDS
jgi:hypothetical protein